MPTLTYRGDYGASITLANPRTAELSTTDIAPSSPILVSAARARIYVSTTARSYTFQYHVAIDGGYTGDLSYKFSSNDEPVYVDVPIDVQALDPNFPLRSISTITVSDLSGHGSNTRIRGSVRVIVDYVDIQAPNPPQNIRIDGATAINLEAAHTAELTWSAATVRQYDTFGSYAVIRYSVSEGTYTTVGYTTGLSMTVEAPYTDSKSYYYYVDVITANYTRRSGTFASIYTFIQLTAPTFLGGSGYNPRPTVLVELGEGPVGEYLTLIANGWTPSRQGYPGDHVLLRKDTAYTASASDTVSVRETDERMRTIDTDMSVSYTAPTYTTPDIVAGRTIVRAADITELQMKLAAIRAAYGMEEYWFTACLPQETSMTLWPTHIAEIHACIREIQSFINSWDLDSPSWALILPTLITSPGPSAAVMRQLRQIITML